MSDATIRFDVALRPDGTVAAVRAIDQLAQKAQQAGSAFGRAVSSGVEEAVKAWGKFLASGSAAVATIRGALATWEQAVSRAQSRLTEWQNKMTEWQRRNAQAQQEFAAVQVTAATFRLAGVPEADAKALAAEVRALQTSGREQEARGFMEVFRAMATRFDGAALGAAAVEALAAFRERGHLPGFAEAYAALRSAEVPAGEDIRDLATGVAAAMMRLPDELGQALLRGIRSGAITIAPGGALVATTPEAAPAVKAAMERMSGSISLRELGPPEWVSQVTDRRLGFAYQTRPARDAGLSWEAPPELPGRPSEADRPSATPTLEDVASAALQSPVVQGLLAGLSIKLTEMLIEKIRKMPGPVAPPAPQTGGAPAPRTAMPGAGATGAAGGGMAAALIAGGAAALPVAATTAIAAAMSRDPATPPAPLLAPAADVGAVAQSARAMGVLPNMADPALARIAQGLEALEYYARQQTRLLDSIVRRPGFMPPAVDSLPVP